ncbi:MAG: thioredoxin family protein [Muribaculaceae bacterium]|nr:thioredoxin family protein [Muribaculaceae bacterium]
MTYKEEIAQPGVVLVEFYASWCPHCRKMMPVVEQVKNLLTDRARVAQYDIDACEADADAAKVEVVPTFIIYKDSAEKWRHSGEISADDLISEVEKVL